ncbi:unnamed protein product [Dovyalis caffra]|uniref:Late embryogenesis abundant protein LEA-2 subgroup domain-containing protein n=1 Tax=Dovyalis caffra TaxID=77055 RepID=A0AAV1RRD9_9ROSI|nr:unnamed protein product [Dovyalis caffra]
MVELRLHLLASQTNPGLDLGGLHICVVKMMACTVSEDINLNKSGPSPIRNLIMVAPKVEIAKKKSNLLYLILGGVAFIIFFVIAISFYLGVLPLPHKPQFILEDTTLCGLKFSAPNLLTCNLQVTLSTRNPNTNYLISIEKPDVRAFYQNQQITVATELPRTYLSPKNSIKWPSFLYGNDVPITPHAAANLMVDLNDGILPLDIKVDAGLKWKISSFTSGKYRLTVNCRADISLGGQNNGTSFELGTKYVLEQPCKVQIENN